MPPPLSDTIADLHTLMTDPPHLRRGNTRWFREPAPPAAGSSYTYPVSNDYWERIVAVAFTLTTSAAAVNRSVSLVWADDGGTAIATVPAVPIATASQVIPVTALLQAVPVPAPGQTLNAYGSQAAPGAGTTIANAGVLPSGLYSIAWTVEVSGPVAAGTDNDNMQLFVGGTAVARAIYPAVAGSYPQATAIVWIAGASALTIRNVAAATAGTTYAAALTATQLSGTPMVARIPDLILKSGWKLQVNVAGMQAADTLTGIAVLAERYSSDWAGGTLGSDEERAVREWLAWATREQPDRA
jgi:hypothetical protein